MGESETRAVERMLTHSMQEALDGFRRYAFNLTFPEKEEQAPGAGARGPQRHSSDTSFGL